MTTVEQLLQELLLRIDAETSLLKFIEVCSPDTKPAAHHRLLLSKLEAVIGHAGARERKPSTSLMANALLAGISC
jgi:hypothetical protein